MDIGHMHIANAQGGALGPSLEVMRTSNAWERGRGLLGRRPLGHGQGLWISPCNSVHGFGMGYALDLVYLDKGLRVLKLVAGFRPWRLSWCLGARSVLELPAGSINDFGIQSGFILEWQSYAN